MDCLVEDSSFLIALLSPIDEFHTEALTTSTILKDAHDLTLIFPSTVIFETSFVLMKSGVDPEVIRDRINKISMFPKVLLFQSDMLSSLRYVSRYYNSFTRSADIRTITKTSDYLIACVAKDLQASVVSADEQMVDCLNSLGIKCFDFSKEDQREEIKRFYTEVPF